MTSNHDMRIRHQRHENSKGINEKEPMHKKYQRSTSSYTTSTTARFSPNSISRREKLERSQHSVHHGVTTAQNNRSSERNHLKMSSMKPCSRFLETSQTTLMKEISDILFEARDTEEHCKSCRQSCKEHNNTEPTKRSVNQQREV